MVVEPADDIELTVHHAASRTAADPGETPDFDKLALFHVLIEKPDPFAYDRAAIRRQRTEQETSPIHVLRESPASSTPEWGRGGGIQGDIMRLSPMGQRLSSILAELRAALEKTYERRLVQVILYGSQARGDAEAGSDIDVLVVLKGPVRPGEEIARLGPFLTDLLLAHGTLVSCAFVSEERFRREQSPFLMNVRREGVVV